MHRIVLLLVAVLPLVHARGSAQASNGDTTSFAQVVMLGTGTPNPDPARSGPSVAIVVNGRAYLVDCGPGVVRRAAAAAMRTGLRALEPQNLAVVFITHLHFDHTLGLPDLMLSSWGAGRATPLAVYGPPGVAAMAQHLAEAYREDIQNRTTGLEPANRTGYKIVAHEVNEGVVYRDSNVTVRAFAVSHANWRFAFGYRFETKHRTIVVSGDTRPSEAVVRACDSCDVLVHEVYSAAALARRSAEWQRYHTNAHTSAVELGALAARAHPKLLVLYHQLYWGATDDDLLREVRQGFAGRVVSGEDLATY